MIVPNGLYTRVLRKPEKQRQEELLAEWSARLRVQPSKEFKVEFSCAYSCLLQFTVSVLFVWNFHCRNGGLMPIFEKCSVLCPIACTFNSTWWNSRAWLMDPQFLCWMGEKKLRPRTRLRQRRMLTAEKMGLTKNIWRKCSTKMKIRMISILHFYSSRKSVFFEVKLSLWQFKPDCLFVWLALEQAWRGYRPEKQLLNQALAVESRDLTNHPFRQLA